MNATRKNISVLVFVALGIIYYLFTDPDLGIISNLPFGAELLIVLNIFVLSALSIALIEMAPRLFFDGGELDGDERDLIRKAKNDAKAAATIYLGNSIRTVGYAIIVGATIYGTIN
jgi:hypothetical protein